ncbi:hypothetical protein Dsin_003169 [Dipteronia sinensis]|uniref:DUF8039 domain-containing protein n=1 Tax=Dipteronia sinensis TaxID=43782 RepID=A0AAE0B8H2_9ROSI|nr:hypothetical protein Dsin_003169 [Dipteronia sinensis]
MSSIHSKGRIVRSLGHGLESTLACTKDLEGKTVCKVSLQQQLGLSKNASNILVDCILTFQINDKHEYSKCQPLHWYGDNVEEVVAEGSVASTDPNTKVHHVPLGRDLWRVWVDLVFNSDVILVQPTDETRTLGGVVGSTIAWPKSCIM